MKRFVALTVGCLLLGTGIVQAQGSKKEEAAKAVKSLKDKDEKSRISACQKLADIGKLKAAYAKDAVEPLTSLVRKDDSAKVRAEAANTLGVIDPEEYKPVIEALAEAVKEDKDNGVHQAAITALGSLGGKSKDALPVLVEEQDKYKKQIEDAKDDKNKIKRIRAQMKPVDAAIRSIKSQLK
jgi:HEAT repeat protein